MVSALASVCCARFLIVTFAMSVLVVNLWQYCATICYNLNTILKCFVNRTRREKRLHLFCFYTFVYELVRKWQTDRQTDGRARQVVWRRSIDVCGLWPVYTYDADTTRFSVVGVNWPLHRIANGFVISIKMLSSFFHFFLFVVFFLSNFFELKTRSWPRVTVVGTKPTTQRLTQPGQPSVGRCNEYQLKLGA